LNRLRRVVPTRKPSLKPINLSATSPLINIVWFKRDLRLRDHEPLARAQAAGLPVLRENVRILQRHTVADREARAGIKIENG